MYRRNRFQEGGQQQQPSAEQIIQMFAEANGQDPNEVMQQLQQLSPEEQQQAIAQMTEQLQGSSQQQQPDVMQMIMEMLQQGATPEQVIQQLVQSGVPQEQAMQALQMVMEQSQQQQPQMKMGGYVEQYQMGSNIQNPFTAMQFNNPTLQFPETLGYQAPTNPLQGSNPLSNSSLGNYQQKFMSETENVYLKAPNLQGGQEEQNPYNAYAYGDPRSNLQAGMYEFGRGNNKAGVFGTVAGVLGTAREAMSAFGVGKREMTLEELEQDEMRRLKVKPTKTLKTGGLIKSYTYDPKQKGYIVEFED